MKKTVRISTINDHERHRVDDVRQMSPDERVMLLLNMQRRFYAWNDNNRIKRVAKITRLKE